MAGIVLYREMITKGPARLFGGYRAAIRSIQASWTPVTVWIDEDTSVTLKTGLPFFVDLLPGHHRIRSEAKGFVSADAHIEVGSDDRQIVVITPAYRDGASPTMPLGELRVRHARGPEDLQPYNFYRELPFSIGRTTVFPSVLWSLLMSTIAAGLGLAPVVLALVFVTKSWGVSLFVLACGLLITPVMLPAGLGGIVAALRFLRLPVTWRAPERVSAS